MTRVWFPSAWQSYVTSYNWGLYADQNKGEERRKALGRTVEGTFL